MSDTARRHPAQVQAEEKYPWQGHGGSYDRETDLKRTAFLAGWDAAIEHAAQVAEKHWPANVVHARNIATAIRAERSAR